MVNIRGGGEYGPAWHQAALKNKRQRAYDDFIAIAEDLIKRKVTSTPKLGIRGGSNGGLLMGVMMTQRPALFGAIVCQVPLLDMMRYHKLLAVRARELIQFRCALMKSSTSARSTRKTPPVPPHDPFRANDVTPAMTLLVPM